MPFGDVLYFAAADVVFDVDDERPAGFQHPFCLNPRFVVEVPVVVAPLQPGG